MAGVPLSVPLKAIIPALFQNNRSKSTTNSSTSIINSSTNIISSSTSIKTYYTFARAALTDDQIAQIIYPSGFTSLNFYIVYQVDTGETYLQHLVAFATKYDGYIYGLYYDIQSQDRYDRCVLKTSKEPITIDSNAIFIDGQYIELYLCILNNPTILGLVTKTGPLASIQYSKGNEYIRVFTGIDGIEGVNPKITRQGLSNSLKHI